MEYIPSVVQAITGDNHTVFAYFPMDRFITST